jgi:hypothetical protein
MCPQAPFELEVSLAHNEGDKHVVKGCLVLHSAAD